MNTTSPTAATPPTIPSITTQIAAKAPDLSKTEQARLASAIDTENRLVGEAVTKLGGTPVPVTTLGRLKVEAPFSNGTKADRKLWIPLGTTVADGPESSWSVTGVKDGQVQLARRNGQTNAIEQATKSIGELAERTSSLVEDQWTDAAGKRWNIHADADDVQSFGRDAKVKLVRDYSDREAAEAIKQDAASLKLGSIVRTTWGTILDDMASAKRTPAVVPASTDGALSLRQIVGDKTFAITGVGSNDGYRRVLAATDAAPDGARDAFKGAQQVQQWFKDKVGITFWPDREPLLIHADEPNYVANAAAAIGQDGTNRSFHLLEGPRSESMRQALLRRAPAGGTGTDDQLIRHYSDMVKKNDGFVRYHEAGHIANGMTWSHISQTNVDNGDDHAMSVETGMVNEAFADIFGLAKSGNAHPALRNLTSLNHKWATLDAYRDMLAKQGKDADEHDGTQLLTKPIGEFAKTMGVDAVASVAGGANSLLASGLSRGDFDVVDVPHAAQALLDAAASRFGIDSPSVKALQDSWTKLGVLKS